MQKFFYTLVLSVLCSLFGVLYAQITFENANNKLNFGDHFSGVAIGVADMNADGYDDIIHLRNSRILTIRLQKPDGAGFITINAGQVSNSSQWSMCIADADNNGFNDVVCGGSYDGVKLVRASADGTSYTIGNLPGTNIFLQGSNFADINNDGQLDIFACHDDGNNRIWANTGNGVFTPANNWIDMATVPASDNSGNYGSVWTDFDNDGDLDLYIAKCRSGVNNPADGRRINQLFINEGNGVFRQDTADIHRLRIGAQSWTADFGDIDNDGDLDCFITNHDVASQLLLNDGNGIFTDVTNGSGINVQGLPVQGIFRDFDNDGWVDIIVSGTRHHLYRNNGNGTFTDVGLQAFGTVQMESFAVGDLNHDGRLDVYGGYALIYTTPSNIPDVVWLNTTVNDNHYLAVRLEGTTSNRSAVGARITIHGPWGVQVREVRSGESYGIMNSLYQHFGLGPYTSVDSLVVRWPSGLREVFYNVPADQSIQIKEGECISPYVSLNIGGPRVFCLGDSLVLTVVGGTQHQWSNGAEGPQLVVRQSGSYSAVVTAANNSCRTITPAIEVVVDPPAFPVIEALGDTVFCPGESVVLQASAASSYQWSNGATTQSVTVSQPGSYFVSVPGLCRLFDSPPISVRLLDAPVPTVANDTLTAPGVALLRAAGDAPRWYDVPVGGQVLFTGELFEIPMLTATDTFYVEDPEIYPGGTDTAGPPAHAGSSQYSGNNTNGALIFDAFQPFTLQRVRVYTDASGRRIIELRNSAGTVLQSVPVDLVPGDTVITLNIEVPVGINFSLTTNQTQNQQTFGFNGPRLRRTSGNVSYPYTVPGVLSIKNTNFGTDVYYYFYNWDIKLQDKVCVSERVPVYAVLLEPNAVKEPDSEWQLIAAPNPAQRQTQLRLPNALPEPAVLTVTNAQGQLLQRSAWPAGQDWLNLEVAAWPAGVYYLQLTAPNGSSMRYALVVQ